MRGLKLSMRPKALASFVLVCGLAPGMVQVVAAQEYESSPGTSTAQPMQYGEQPAGEPAIDGVAPIENPNPGQPWRPAGQPYPQEGGAPYGVPTYGAPSVYGQPGEGQSSEQMPYAPPTFSNPMPVTRRYGAPPAYPHTGQAFTTGYTTQWTPGVANGYLPQSSAIQPANAVGQYSQQFGQQPGMQYGQVNTYMPQRMATAPQGLTLPCTLNTAISTDVAKEGDLVQASLAQNVALGGAAYLPAGTVITGQVTNSIGGRHFDRSGSLSLAFNQMRLPDGATFNISARTVGNIGKYANKGSGDSDQYRGEGWGAKLGGLAIRTALGAAGGLAMGTAVGGISGNWGTGMWAGSALGAGAGALEDLTWRRGKNVVISSGTNLTIQLNQPIQIPLGDFQ